MKPLQRMSAQLNGMNELYIAIITEELARCGFTMPQLIVLDKLKGGPKTIGEISQLVDLSYSTVSGIVDRLERNGLVIRNRDDQDRRIVRVSLADSLQSLEEKIPCMKEGYFENLFAGMTEEEMEKCSEILAMITTYLQKRWDMLQKGGKSSP
ncbi:MarR family winged helix-turn-helix transcriptional regulator [Brevibacillus sp. H7]|jgi:DNA-binding MarR family transcriptional regulator|uniref:MarR family winged helix-turn-helix transcriptional regulator n=1 Tax=Brevibacillus sp. H7 TaxID=3349138 RepID=UPI003827BD0D